MRALHLFACAIPSGIILALLLAHATPASAQTVAWVNSAGGSYDASGNWLPAAIPGSGSILDFPLSNTYTVTMPTNRSATSAFLDAGIVTFAGGNTLTLSTELDISTALLILSNASYNVSGAATLNTNGRIRITQGRLTVDSLQMARNLGDASLTVTGGSSSLVVNGPAASFVGQGGFSGTLTITNSGTASFGGAINLASSSTAGTTGMLSIGTSSTVTTSTIGAGTGGQTGQAGTILLNGDNASLTQTGTAALTLGAATNSIGFLSIAANSTFTTGSGAVTINPTGTLSLAGKLNLNGDLNLNGGALLASGAGSLSTTLGKAVNVTNGGSLLLPQSAVVPTTLLVSGPGSVASFANAVLGNPNGGSQSVSVTNGGSLSASTLHEGFGDDSTVLVDGPGSAVTISGSVLLANNSGQATVTVSNGASFKATGPIVMSDQSGNSKSAISALSGATVTAASIVIGQNITAPGSNAAVLVSDPGTSFTLTGSGSVTIGTSIDAFGTLTIDNGAHFTSGTGRVQVNSRGLLDIRSGTFTCNGSIDLSGGTVNIGGSLSGPPGLLELAAGFGHGIQLGGGALNLLANGVLNVNGAVINAPTINFAGGSLNFNAGAIGLSGTSINLNGQLIANLLGPQATLFPNHALITSGTVSLGASLLVDGGTLSVATLNGGGALLNLRSGTFNLTAEPLLIGSSGDFGLIVTVPAGMTLAATGAAGTINSGGLLQIAGGTFSGSSFTINSGGQLALAGISARCITGTISNSGLINGTGRIISTVSNNAGGIIRADTADHLTITSFGDTNSGTIQLLGGAIEFTQPLTNNLGGAISGHGSFFSGGLTNNGSLTLVGPDASVFGSVTNSASARVLVTAGCNATFFDAVTNQAGSIFKVSDASVAAFLSPVTGLGAFTGNGTTIFESTASGGALTAGTTVVDAANGSLTATSIRQPSLIVRGQAAIAPNGTNASTSRLSALAIELGTVDLNDNDLVIDYSGANPFNTVRSYLASGALRSSLADATHRLGYADNATLGLATFSGQAVDATSILVKYTFAGDANLDGQVDVTDLGALATNWQTIAPWTGGDFNYDGFVDVTDLGALATNWQAGVGSPLAPSRLDEALASVGLSSTGVPEPFTFALLVASPAFLRRRQPRIG